MFWFSSPVENWLPFLFSVTNRRSSLIFGCARAGVPKSPRAETSRIGSFCAFGGARYHSDVLDKIRSVSGPGRGRWSERLRSFRDRHPKAEALTFFAGGFCFDLLLLERIDSVPMLIHQGSYLVLLSFLLALDHRYTVYPHPPAGFWGKLLHHRHEMIHFLFGTLLNAFLVFYFKAASGIFSLLFMVALGAILIANELPTFRRLGPIMRVALHGFAVTSYFAYLLPVLVGRLGAWLFVSAAFISSGAIYAQWRLYSRWTPDLRWTFRRAVLPTLAIQALLIAFYFAHVLPPVPLSLKWIGIYHDAQLEGSRVRVSEMRPFWRFWEHGDQQFLARPGDRIFCFVRVFAPRHFKDALKVRWAYRDRNQWQQTDAIPLTISGGQEEGWRGIAYKRNYSPGTWKVMIETDDGREVGSIRFKVLDDPSSGGRLFHAELR